METLIILALAAVTCAIPGVYLVLRGLAMTADAISHTVLLGIVLAFFVVRDLDSPALIISAAVMGVVTVLAIELLVKTRLVKSDASIGIVFSLFFALAVLLISKYARNSNLDVDVILMGEVLYAPLRRMDVFGMSLPVSLVYLSIMLALNLAFIAVFWKELKLGSFDPGFAMVAGFGSALLYYALMTLVSLTAVVSFDTVGSVLVIAFFACPAAVGVLCTKRMWQMIVVAVTTALLMSVVSYVVSMAVDVSLSGMAAVVGGVCVLLAALFGPHGTALTAFRRRSIAAQLDDMALLVHIGNHEKDASAAEELGAATMSEHMGWSEAKLARHLDSLKKQGYALEGAGGVYHLTERGRPVYEAQS